MKSEPPRGGQPPPGGEQPPTGAEQGSGAAHPAALVIGYGNTLRRDDGVGVCAAELMAADRRFSGAEILTAHQLTPELAIDLAGRDLVVFVDADVRGLPGSIDVHALGATGRDPSGDRAGANDDPGSSSHHVGVEELLALARELVGARPRAVAVGIGVADLELGDGLSEAVEDSLPRVLDVVARLLEGQSMG